MHGLVDRDSVPLDSKRKIGMCSEVQISRFKARGAIDPYNPRLSIHEACLLSTIASKGGEVLSEVLTVRGTGPNSVCFEFRASRL
jgi:hypothetical protein